MRAVVADDDRGTATMLAAALRRWDFDVHVADDGTAAWNAIADGRGPTLAVVDWMMPGADGIEICRRARSVSLAEPVHVSC